MLTPRIFHHLRTMPPGAGGEIQLTDGIARLLDDESVLAYEFDGRRYDCGSKLGYLEATVELGAEASRGRRRTSPLPRSALRMTLNELRYIVAVAHERSFGRARRSSASSASRRCRWRSRSSRRSWARRCSSAARAR